MPKRPDTHESVLLALEIMRRIPRKNYISATAICAQLLGTPYERDIRTIQRQLEMLSEHFDIERHDGSKPYGYRWKEHASGMAINSLTEQEALILTLAEQYLRSLLPVDIMKSMDGFFRQARKINDPLSSAKKEKEWLKKVRVVSTTQPLLPPDIRPEVFDAVSHSLYNNLWLNIVYKNAGGKISESEVMPLGLAQQGSRLYLVCRYRDYDDDRSLAVNRIQSAKCSTISFARPREFNLEKYDNDGKFGYGEGQRIKLKFSIEKYSGIHLIESKLSTDQSVIDHGEYLEIHATLVDTAMLEWWLNGFGENVWDISKTPILD